MPIDSPDTFEQRHIGPDEKQQAEMLRVIGARSLDALIDAALPASIRLKKPLQLPPAETEHEYLDRLRTVAAKNQRFKSFIGMGYYGTITPSVILRNLFENPSWYTPYTPYQAEIAQGRLESLLNFQTMVQRPDGDGNRDGVAAGRGDGGRRGHDAAASCAGPPGIGRAKHILGFRAHLSAGARGAEGTRGAARHHHRVRRPVTTAQFGADVFGAYVQSPDDYGALIDLRPFIARAHERNVLVAVGQRSSRAHHDGAPR